MSQDSGQWPPQGQPGGGYPPSGPPGNYPPQGQPAGYPASGQPGGYPPPGPGGYPQQPPPGGYPPQPQPGGYPPQGAYGPQGAYIPQGGYAPQQPGLPPGGPGGYPPLGPPGGGPAGPAGKKSPAMIIGIVAAAVVLLAAVGGIILVLNRGDDAQPGSTITPGTPTTEPTTEPSGQPTAAPSRSSSPQPTTSAPTGSPTEKPSGEAIDLGHDINLSPAEGYELEKSGNGYARLSNGEQLFLGQAIQVDPGTNPGQLCDAWHRKIAEGQANGKFADPKTTDLGTRRLKGATCEGTFTASSGSGSQDIFVFSLVSVRTDGVTVLGTMYFLKDANSDQLDSDFTAMTDSMLQDQAAGG